MRVLVISEYLPYPPDHGGKIRVFELLRRVAQRHEVTLAALVDSDAERQHIPRLESYGIRVLAALRPPIGQDIRSKVRRLLDVRPRIMSESASPELRAKIRAYVRHRAPDVIHCEQLHVAQYAAPYSHIPGLLVAHTARYEDLVRQIAGARPTLQSRIAGRLDALKVRRIERRAWRTFIACAAVSEHDRAPSRWRNA
jgi:glycosyltransferase involved in cell wall biosynthesis